MFPSRLSRFRSSASVSGLIGVAMGDARENTGARTARKPRLEVSILMDVF